jgi:hypothetical protein
MMTALFVWMGISTLATLGIVSAMALASRRHIPAITTETGAESMILLNRGTASAGGSEYATSLAR